MTKGKRSYTVIGGRLSGFVPNVTFNPVAAPGSLEDFFMGKTLGKRASETARLEPLQPAYQHREPRLQAMAEQGVEEIVLLPTFTCCIEESLADDLEATYAVLHSHNRWLHEEWGFGGPTIAAPVIAMSDVDASLAEIEWVLSEGARVLCMMPGPVRVPGGGRRRSPANEHYDPIWKLIDEAGVTVAYHAADSGYFRYFQDYDDPPVMDAFSPYMRLGSLFSVDRPIQDMLGVFVMQRLFERFPNLRIIAVEQGSDWLGGLVHKLDKLYHRRTRLFAEPPMDTVRRHIWVCPFWEDDIDALVDLVGVTHVVFGSDWPHPEGVAEPEQFTKYLSGLSPQDTRLVMRENGRELLELRRR